MSNSEGDTIGIPSGLLTDEDILELGRNNQLITENFNEEGVKQTCYELRVGCIAHFLLREEYERQVPVSNEDPVIMKPGDVVTIITYEKLELPENILGRIISKGTLFSIGLSPVITYADPGFSGNLGITFINHSRKSLKFNFLEPICKIEFEKLGKNVSNPYRGPHNLAERIWPIDRSRFLAPRKISDEQINNENFINDEIKFYGEPFDLFFNKMDSIDKKYDNKIRLLTTIIFGLLAFNILSFISLNIHTSLGISKEILDLLISILLMVGKEFLQKYIFNK